MGKTGKRIVCLCAAVIAILLVGMAIGGFVATKVATIVDDEASWDIRDSSPSKKVLILADGTVARFVREDGASYVGEIQDEFSVSKDEAQVETWYACDGKGVVYLKDFGTEPVFSKADPASDIVGYLENEEGYIPSSYNCLGFKDGWFTVRVEGNTGYIPEDKVDWDAIDTF